MPHSCITGEITPPDGFRYLTENHQPFSFEHHDHGTWAAEQELMKMVEEGNLDYIQGLQNLSSTGQTGTLSENSLQNVKYLVIVHVALVCRAAIRGGLSTEMAFSLSDIYIQKTDQCDSFEEIAKVHRAMLSDYVHRVHQCRLQDACSSAIQECCDYIRLHYTEKLNITDIAARVGYTGNYLSKKFKQEMGVNIVEYITSVKIDAAKELLRSQKSIAEISDMLGFHSQSYFGAQFKKVTGITPKEFQQKGFG